MWLFVCVLKTGSQKWLFGVQAMTLNPAAVMQGEKQPVPAKGNRKTEGVYCLVYHLWKVSSYNWPCGAVVGQHLKSILLCLSLSRALLLLLLICFSQASRFATV